MLHDKLKSDMPGCPQCFSGRLQNKCHQEQRCKTVFPERWYWTWEYSLWGWHNAGRGEFEVLVLRGSLHTSITSALWGPQPGLAGAASSVQEAKRRIDFRNVSWGSGFYRRIGCQTLNYWKTKIFTLLDFSFNLCSVPSVPVPFRGDVAFPTLQSLAPFCLSLLLCRWHLCMEMMGIWTSLLVQDTKKVVEAQPVMLLKPGLSSCFSKGGIKAQRAGVFPPRDRATMAGKPGVFAQAGSHSGSQGHPDLPSAAHEQKGAGGLRKKQLGPGGNTTKKKQDPHIRFSFACPKPSPLAALPPAAVLQTHSLPGPTAPPRRLCSHQEMPVSCQKQKKRSQGTRSPCCAWGAMRNNSYTNFRGP